MTVSTLPATTRRTQPPMLAEVVATRMLTPHLRRITLSGPDLDCFGYDGPDHMVRIFLAPSPGAELHLPDSAQWWPAMQAMPEQSRPVVRNYTVRRLDLARREIDIDFVLHGDGGPASAWARTAAPGDRIGVFSDRASYAPPADTDWQLFVGDETALPAITSALESLPTGTRAIALIEVGTAADEIDVRTRTRHHTDLAAPRQHSGRAERRADPGAARVDDAARHAVRLRRRRVLDGHDHPPAPLHGPRHRQGARLLRWLLEARRALRPGRRG